MRDKLLAHITDLIRTRTAADAAEAIMADLGLQVVFTYQSHGAGSAIESGETEEDYLDRIQQKTVYRLEGRWVEPDGPKPARRAVGMGDPAPRRGRLARWLGR